MVGEIRLSHGRNVSTRFLIVDAQSVKNTETAHAKGYDAAKKVSGIKRHIAVDSQCLPHAIAVTTADKTDRQGALAAFTLHKECWGQVLPFAFQGMLGSGLAFCL